MKKRFNWLLVLVSLMVLSLGIGSALAAGVAFTVTESSVYHSDYGGYYDLFFTVDNPFTADIREFAVGNNNAGSVWVDGSASAPPDFLTEGRIAYNDGGEEGSSWYTWTNTGKRTLTWLNNASGFDGYSKAFLYTSWGYDNSGYNGYLETGFTNGYRGNTLELSSPFAAYSEDAGVGSPITGETSAVPIPGALWLFGSGLLGLVAVRRRKEADE